MSEDIFPELESLTNLVALMRQQGVTQLYAKRLSPNDNSKNQIYIGGSFDVLNILPFGAVYADKSREDSKRDRYKAAMDFSWIDNTGAVHKAPHTQLILYPKYPEVRISGFLQGCNKAPREALNNRYEGRVLFLGITDTGNIIAHATLPHNPINNAIPERDEDDGVLQSLSLETGTEADDSRQRLMEELRQIHLRGWIDSVKMCGDGILAPCRSSNCGGYTLEAQFGIQPNGYGAPDYLGWELKQHNVSSLDDPTSGSPITLMTPEPTGGYYKKEGSEAFIYRFGYPDQKSRPDRLNFGGIHKAGQRTARSGLTMTLTGYDAGRKRIDDISGGITLMTPEGEEAATWHYTEILELWNRKHAHAAYVPSNCRLEPHRQYKFGNLIELGIGTNFSKFLEAVANGYIYLDPALKLEQASTDSPKKKCRNQFRIKLQDLSGLYREFETVDVLK